MPDLQPGDFVTCTDASLGRHGDQGLTPGKLYTVTQTTQTLTDTEYGDKPKACRLKEAQLPPNAWWSQSRFKLTHRPAKGVFDAREFVEYTKEPDSQILDAK